MSTTLTNGLKLPDKGSVDWYADMQNNYSILDGAVGTIAEHTTALAGKAPLVHTHTKSDITDLFNSNFIPSANNSYDLGSSSYQWKSVYAQSYYYNGVAWGLDKQNEWTNIQRMTSNPAVWYLRNNTVTLGTAPSSNRYLGTFFEDVNGDSLGHISFQANKSGENSIQFNIANSDGTNAYTTKMRLKLAQDGTSVFIPETDNTIKLGGSGNCWKDFYTYLINSINPGALSLPDCQVAQSIDRTGWVYDGATYNTVLLATTDTNMTKNGWLYVRMANTTSSDKLTIKYNRTADRYPTNTFGGAGGCIEAFVPVIADTNIYVLATKDLQFCKFYPCLGNVPSGV